MVEDKTPPLIPPVIIDWNVQVVDDVKDEPDEPQPDAPEPEAVQPADSDAGAGPSGLPPPLSSSETDDEEVDVVTGFPALTDSEADDEEEVDKKSKKRRRSLPGFTQEQLKGFKKANRTKYQVFKIVFYHKTVKS